MIFMLFEDALYNMRQGLKLTTQEVIENPYVRDYYYTLSDNVFYRTYIENGLICKIPPTTEEILDRNWFVYLEEGE